MFSIPTMHGSLSKLLQKDYSNLLFNGSIHCSTQDDQHIYLGGDFTNIINTTLTKSYRNALINKLDGSLVNSVVRSYLNGDVNSYAIDGEYMYIGGSFTSYNNVTRNRIAKINIQTGILDSVFDPGDGFNNNVFSIILDGNDLYICGSFNRYNNIMAQGLVKINKTTGAYDGSFNTSTGFDSSVYSMLLNGNDLYIGGAFSSYKGQTRNRLVKINKLTAAVDPVFDISGGFSSSIYTLALDGNNLYVGGAFSSYKGQTRNRLAKINKDTAIEVDTVGTGFSTTSGFDSSVNSLLLDGNNLYAGGMFTAYKNKVRERIVKIDKTTAAEVDASGTGFSTTSGFSFQIKTMMVDGNNLYVGGAFSSYKGNTRGHIVKINKDTAAEVDASGTGFSTTSGFNNAVYSMASTPYGLYVSGSFTTYKLDNFFNRSRIVKINKKTSLIDTDFNTSSGFNSSVLSILVNENDLYVGGSFSGYSSNDRQYLAKINKITAAIDPVFDISGGFSSSIYTLALDGNNLYVGGQFTFYKENARQRIVKIDKITAAEVDPNGTGFSTTSGFNNTVRSILLDGNNLYAGGVFTAYKNKVRGRIVKIDKTTAAEVDASGTGFSKGGDVDLSSPFDPIVSYGFTDYVTSLLIDGNNIYVGGGFSGYMDGLSTIITSNLAKINKNTAILESFGASSKFNNPVNLIAIDGNNLYIGGLFTSYLSNTRQRIVKIDKTTAAEVDASGTGFSTTSGFSAQVSSILLDNNYIYISGSFTTYKNNSKTHFIVLDKNNISTSLKYFILG